MTSDPEPLGPAHAAGIRAERARTRSAEIEERLGQLRAPGVPAVASALAAAAALAHSEIAHEHNAAAGAEARAAGERDATAHDLAAEMHQAQGDAGDAERHREGARGARERLD